MSKILNMLGGIFGWNQNIVTIQSVNNGLYLLNDPSTPELAIPQTLPIKPEHLMFSVNEFNPTKLHSQEFKDVCTVNCYITICNSARYFQTMLKDFDQPCAGWAATPNLTVLPFAGSDFNAFYNRASLQFFAGVNPATRKTVAASASNDVVTHELGHAFLDILRPDFWNIQSFEIWAFHEAFGDINAIAHALQYDQIIMRALDETNGDLLKAAILNSNIVSRIGEEMAMALFSGTSQAARGIRDLSDKFVYTDPLKLPQKGENDKLCAEIHNFSRVFSGAWYEILVRIFEKERGVMGDLQAIKHARDIAYSRLLKAITMAPASIKFFDTLAKCMIAAEKMKDGVYAQIMEDVFNAREILRPVIRMLSDVRCSDIMAKMEPKDMAAKKGDLVVIRKPRSKKFRISDHWVADLSSSNPIYNVELEVPGDSFYIFDRQSLIEESHPSDDEILESSVLCALAIKNYYGLGEDKMWRINKDKLVRNHVACCHRPI